MKPNQSGGEKIKNKPLTMLAVGDMSFGPGGMDFGPGGEEIMSLATPTLRAADVVVGQLEMPHADSGADAARRGMGTRALSAYVSNNFSVLTYIGNHLVFFGVAGIRDTINWLRDHNIAAVGAGMDIAEARQPAIIERDGVRFGFLGYNCVGPKTCWATSIKPGCAYVHVITHYELGHSDPGGPPSIYTWAEPDTLRAMEEDIHKLRPLCDVLVVSLHKGLLHVPAAIASYEQQISYAAIDAGADLILGHHAHVLKGIEQYKGKFIFHGLCNFAVSYPVYSSPRPPGMPPADLGEEALLLADWGAKRQKLYNWKPDPSYTWYPFHPDARQTIIAKCTIDNGKVSRAGYLPCLINKESQPEILKNDERGQQVLDYMDKITKEAGLNGRYEWEGDEVVVHVE